MKTGELIHENRKQNNRSQAWVAIRAGVSQHTVYEWEKSKQLPNIRQLEAIASAFKLEKEALIGDDGVREMKAEDESEKVIRLSGTINEKDSRIKKLEETVKEQKAEIERLMNEIKAIEKPAAELHCENEKLRKVLANLLINKALDEAT